MTTEKSSDIVDTVESEGRPGGGGHNPPVTNFCRAQVGTSQKTATVGKMVTCCDNLVTQVGPIMINMKEIKVAILRGQVKCASASGMNKPGVEGVIVVATTAGGSKNYVGITDVNGNYSICVPATTSSSGTPYTVEAYKCGSCSGGVYEDAPCS